MSRTSTRQEFHDLVWSKPVTHIAREFGLSDVAIHKICKRHDISTPPLGWWAKKAAGKMLKQTPLPKASSGTRDMVIIAGGELREEAPTLRAAREQARVLASSAPSDEPARAHPLVTQTIVRLRKAKPSHQGLVSVADEGLISCNIAPASIDRLELILNRIVAAAAQQGFTLTKGTKNAAFQGHEERLEFSISESFRRVKHELTEKEKVEEEKWRQKVERRKARQSWDYIRHPQFPEWNYVSTGLLALEFESSWSFGSLSPRRSFRDAKVQRLDAMAGDIAVGMVVRPSDFLNSSARISVSHSAWLLVPSPIASKPAHRLPLNVSGKQGGRTDSTRTAPPHDRCRCLARTADPRRLAAIADTARTS